MKNQEKKLTAKTLKEVLWETLQGLKNNKIEIDDLAEEDDGDGLL